jgi:NADH-quinone oxidoreductase subunit N
MGLAAGTEQGAQALLIYLTIYVVMNVGVFAFILNMEKDGKPVTDIGALGLYSRREPGRAAALAVLMFSLAGVPPLVGFFGKFYVLVAAVDAGLVWLAVAGVVAAVIAAFYYLRIVYLMYFAEPADALDGRMPMLHGALLAGSALLMVFGIVNLFGIDGAAATAAAALVR